MKVVLGIWAVQKPFKVSLVNKFLALIAFCGILAADINLPKKI